MEQEIKQDLTERVFNWVASASQSVGEWTAKEVPEFITEFLVWRFYENVFDTVFYICMISFLGTLLGTCLAKTIKHGGAKIAEQKERGRNIDAFESSACICYCAGSVVLGVSFIFYFFGAMPIDHIKDCIQIKVAPKVYLVEAAGDIILQNTGE